MIKLRVKFLFIFMFCLLQVPVELLVSSAVDKNEEKWVLREMKNGFEAMSDSQISSMPDNGKGMSGSSAIWDVPLVGNRFRVSFDLTLGGSNPIEGECDYLSRYMQVFLADAISFPSGESPYKPAPGFRVENGHIQSENQNKDITSRYNQSSAAIVDFGGKTLKAMGKTTFFLELKNDTLSLWAEDGAKNAEISHILLPSEHLLPIRLIIWEFPISESLNA